MTVAGSSDEHHEYEYDTTPREFGGKPGCRVCGRESRHPVHRTSNEYNERYSRKVTIQLGDLEQFVMALGVVDDYIEWMRFFKGVDVPGSGPAVVKQIKEARTLALTLYNAPPPSETNAEPLAQVESLRLDIMDICRKHGMDARQFIVDYGAALKANAVLDRNRDERFVGKELCPDPVYCSQCGQEDRDCYCDPSTPPSNENVQP